ncbi:hypothetical protein CVS40_11138 [Lucilia cuprina]|nr:hypothetical protein CVS40_11138 [Lucilia cuprina]
MLKEKTHVKEMPSPELWRKFLLLKINLEDLTRSEQGIWKVLHTLQHSRYTM